MSRSSAPDSSNHPTWLVPLTLLLTTGTLLGISTNLAKLAGDANLAPLAFLTWSVVGAALILGSVEAMRGQLPPLNPRTLEYFAVAGLVGVAAPNLLFFAAVPVLGLASSRSLSPFLRSSPILGRFSSGWTGFKLAARLGLHWRWEVPLC